jgi:hypothetical protein
MYGATHADWVYYKYVATGVIYVLKFKNLNRKQHTTVNNYIEGLDETLKLAARTETTSFLSINDDQSLAGSKVLSFTREGRKTNHLYRQLFGLDGLKLPQVTVWEKMVDAPELGDYVAELSNDDDQTYTSDDEPTLNEGDGEGSGGMIASENVSIALINDVCSLF